MSYDADLRPLAPILLSLQDGLRAAATGRDGVVVPLAALEPGLRAVLDARARDGVDVVAPPAPRCEDRGG